MKLPVPTAPCPRAGPPPSAPLAQCPGPDRVCYSADSATMRANLNLRRRWLPVLRVGLSRPSALGRLWWFLAWRQCGRCGRSLPQPPGPPPLAGRRRSWPARPQPELVNQPPSRWAGLRRAGAHETRILSWPSPLSQGGARRRAPWSLGPSGLCSRQAQDARAFAPDVDVVGPSCNPFTPLSILKSQWRHASDRDRTRPPPPPHRPCRPPGSTRRTPRSSPATSTILTVQYCT